MIPGFGSLTNSGTMPIGGGQSGSNTGDAHVGGATFGDFTYTKGIEQSHAVLMVAIVAVLVYVVTKS